MKPRVPSATLIRKSAIRGGYHPNMCTVSFDELESSSLTGQQIGLDCTVQYHYLVATQTKLPLFPISGRNNNNNCPVQAADFRNLTRITEAGLPSM